MEKLLKEWIIDLGVIGIMIMIGCSYHISPVTNNTDIAIRIYGDVKSDDAKITMYREEIFQELYREVRGGSGKIPINDLFLVINQNPIRWEPFHVNLIRTSIRGYVRGPETAIKQKVIDIKDMADIVQKILHLYEYDEIKNIDPSWRK